MRFLKRFCCIVLCIIILSLSIGTRYFDLNHMEKVEAVSEGVAIGLSLSAMYAICFYVGTMMYANAPIEMNSLSDDQIVSMGYSTISYMVSHNLLNTTSAPNLPMIGFMDKAGQSVAFSNEAARVIAGTSLLLIQMSANSPDNDDDNDEEDDNTGDDNDKKSDISVSDDLIKMAKSGKDLFACCSTGFAVLLGSIIREQYDKYMNGEESIYEIKEQFFTDFDSRRDSEGLYSVSGHASYNYDFGGKTYFVNIDIVPFTTASYMYLLDDSVYHGYQHYSFFIYEDGIAGGINPKVNLYDSYQDRWFYDTSIAFGSSSWRNFAISLNLPIFSSHEAAKNAFEMEDYSSALNYAKPYHIADWIQDDWKGKLLDPLTGLNALSNWDNIARHQGLNALGNEIDADAFDDYLRDYFTNTNPDDYPLPTPDPSKTPIIWPSGALDPETTIDPSRNPAILPDPSIKPDPGTDPDPGTKPDPGVGPDPGTKPDPGTDPDLGIEELPADELVPSISSSFRDINVDLKDKFPFCIPWDLYYLLTFLSGLSDDSGISTYSDDHGGGGSGRDPGGGGGHSREPVEKKNGAPVFRLPIVIERYGIEEYIIVDMSPFEPLSKISRLLFTLMFVYTLINWTVKIVSVRKDD